MSQKLILLDEIERFGLPEIEVKGKKGYLSRPLIDVLKIKTSKFFKTVNTLSNRNILKAGEDYDIVTYDTAKKTHVPTKKKYVVTNLGTKTNLPHVFYKQGIEKIAIALGRIQKDNTNKQMVPIHETKDSNILDIKKTNTGRDITVAYETVADILQTKMHKDPNTVTRQDLFTLAAIAEAKIQEDKPKVEFAEAVMQSNTEILLKDYAKVLKIGSTKFNQWLKVNGYLMKNGLPYSQFVPRLFTIKEIVVTKDDSPNIIINQKACLTPKGQVFFYQKSRTDETLYQLIKEDYDLSQSEAILVRTLQKKALAGESLDVEDIEQVYEEVYKEYTEEKDQLIKDALSKDE